MSYPESDKNVFRYYVERADASKDGREELPPFYRDPHLCKFIRDFYANRSTSSFIPKFDELFELLPNPVETARLKDGVLERLLDCLDDKKSTGSPMCFNAPTNGDMKARFIPEFSIEVDRMLQVCWNIGKEAYETFEKYGDCWEFEDLLCFPRTFEEEFMGEEEDLEEDLMPKLREIGANFNARDLVDDPGNEAARKYAHTLLQRAYHGSRVVDFVKKHLIHPVLLKRKAEPRPIEDGKPKKPRLVCMVSNVMTTVQRVLYHDAFEHEQTQPNLPTATALDLTTPEETAKLYNRFADQGEVSSSDVQGWEYANDIDSHYRPMFKWLYYWGMVDEKFRLTSEDHRTRLYTMFGEAIISAHRLLQTEDGELLVAPAGMVSSGEYVTFSHNSFKRAALSATMAVNRGLDMRFVKTAGDDCIDDLPDLSADYARYGYKITDYVRQDALTGFDFCSTHFEHNGSYQQNIEKFFVHVIYSNPDEHMLAEQMVAFHDCFSNHPRYFEFLALFSSIKVRA